MSVFGRIGKGLGIIFRPQQLEDRPTPPSWQQTLYGPGAPIRPTAKPWEEDFPRAIDYPPNVNSTIAPRTSYGLMPFNALKLAWETLDELKYVVHLLIKEFEIFEPQLLDEKGNDISATSPYRWIIEKPDRDTDYSTWVARFLQCAIVYDAGCLAWNMADKALEYVDGSTIFCLVDASGHTPQPPDPAYVQIIHGIPFAWYTRDQVWYRPRFTRHDSPYGMSPIEEAWTSCLTLANIKGFELAHYREGNMPEGLLGPDSEDQLTQEQREEYEAVFNSEMSTVTAKARVKILPFKPAWVQLKKADFPKDLYTTNYHSLGIACGVPASELGDTPGKGLGGKGFSDMATQTFYRIGLAPLKRYVESAMNEFLLALGAGGVTFNLALPTEGLDPQTANQSATQQMQGGLRKVNEARAALGLEEVPGGDVQIIVTGKGDVINLTKKLAEGVPEMAPAPSDGAPTSSTSGSTPSTSDDTAPQDGSDSGSATTTQTGDTGDAGDSVTTPPPSASTTTPTAKLHKPRSHTLPLHKGCGVDEGDDEYWGCEVVAPTTLEVPFGGHANEVCIVSLKADGLPPRTAIWKPYGGENPKLIDRIGHPQYLSEGAAYILDRVLGLYVVPVAWVAKVNGEPGSVCLYVPGQSDVKEALPVEQYTRRWVERMAVLDYLGGNLDRRQGQAALGNWLTDPADQSRPIAIDQGLLFPSEWKVVKSPFLDAVANQPLSADLMWTLSHALTWSDLWQDLTLLVGEDPIAITLERLQRAVNAGGLPVDAQDVAPDAVVATGSTETTADGVGNGDGSNTK